jgi:hypothetical protein
MGVCSTKDGNNEENSLQYLLNNIQSNQNNTNNTQKSDFYYFTEFVLKFHFYIKLFNDDQKDTKILTKINGPNDKNIFKVIKAIDQIYDKELHDFTLYSLSIQVSKDSALSPKKMDYLGNTSANSNVSLNELKSNIQNLFDKLCKYKLNKFNKILLEGPPNNLRWIMWNAIANTKYFDIQTKIGVTCKQIYDDLLCSEFNDKNIEKYIRDDLSRTMNYIKYFKSSNWTQSLYNVLKVLVLYDEKLGYCIGMNEIAAIFLIISDCNELETFNVLRYIYSSNYGLGLREFYIDNFPKLNYYIYIILEILRERYPHIYKIKYDNKIENELWIQIWLQQIYSNLLDISITTRLWDCLIAQGSKFIINISLAYIKLYENEIIKCNSVESFLEIFKKRIKFKNDQERSIFRERLIKNSIDINISSKTYSRLTNQYKQIYHNISLKNKASNNNIINTEEIINTNVHISSYTNLNNNTYNDLMEIFKPRNKVDNYEIDTMKKIYKKYQSYKDTKFIEVNNNKEDNKEEDNKEEDNKQDDNKDDNNKNNNDNDDNNNDDNNKDDNNKDDKNKNDNNKNDNDNDENKINTNINNHINLSQNKIDDNDNQMSKRSLLKKENEPETRNVKKKIQIKEIDKNNSLSSETIENDSIHDFSIDNE